MTAFPANADHYWRHFCPCRPWPVQTGFRAVHVTHGENAWPEPDARPWPARCFPSIRD